MSLDPFAAPAPEPEPAASALPVEKPAATAARPSLDEGKVVVTLKGGAGYEAPWIVIHAGSPAEADALLNSEMLELMGKVQRAAGTFRGAAPANPNAPAATSSRPSQPADSTQAPAGAPESPGPGWEFKTGVTKAGRNAGKPWKAWMPPRGSSESPVFFD